MSQPKKRDFVMRVLSLVAMAFGVMTIKEGGAVLFIGGAARVAAGNYVPFVLWFNFFAGFAYVLAGVGIWLHKRISEAAFFQVSYLLLFLSGLKLIYDAVV